MIELKIKKAKNCNGEYAMFISFPYNQKIVDTIRDFPTKDNKVEGALEIYEMPHKGSDGKVPAVST